MDCPDKGVLLEFSYGRLRADSAASIQVHVESCADCSAWVAQQSPNLEASEDTWGGSGAIPSRDFDQAEHGTPTDALLPGMVLVDRYVILDELGQGGLSVVYAAYDRKLDRKIALKLMLPDGSQPGSEDSDGQTRMLREAQALAQLQHPNVVQIHDTGAFADQVFIAEEFVEGSTLTDWLHAEPRSWRDVVTIFRDAGTGLAAAHAKGLIHRDFKPDNVLVGDDGRVRVSDFGLARVVDDEGQAKPEAGTGSLSGPGSLNVSSSSGGALATPLTRTGDLLGTPAYMALEQLLAKPTTPRTDQFSFCVALYEGLYGHRPFEGNTLREITSSIATNTVRPTPKDAKVPPWLRRIVLRGLNPSPDKRWASMEELLDELAKDPGAVRRRNAMFAGGGFALLLLVAGVYQFASPDLCKNMDARLNGVWDADVKAAVRAAFIATGRPYAADTYQRVAQALDKYALDWVTMSTQACEATHIHGTQSGELLDLRTACLDRHLHKLGALADLFATNAKADVLDRAVEASHSISGLEYCQDTKALTALVPPPEDAEIRVRVERLEVELDRVEADEIAGRYKPGLESAERVWYEVSAIKHQPMRAEALHRLGSLLDRVGEYEAAELVLRRAAAAAAAGKDGRRHASVWARLAWIVGHQQNRYEQAIGYADFAQQVLLLGGGAPGTDASFLSEKGEIRRIAGDYDYALRDLQAALAILERDLGAKHPEVALTLSRTGGVLHKLEKLEEAQQYFERALAIQEEHLGSGHPYVGVTLSNLASNYVELRRFDKAATAQKRAVAIQRDALGENHPHLGISVYTLGWMLSEQGRCGEAVAPLTDALQILQESVGPDHLWTAYALTELGRCEVDMGRPDSAIPLLRRALAIRTGASVGAAELARTRFALARATDDRSLAREALQSYRKLPGEDHEQARIEKWLAKIGGS